MRRFILRFLMICIPIILCYGFRTAYLLSDDRYKESIPGNEIYRSIEKSKKHTKYKKLILGDSTGNQLFNNQKDTLGIYSLACNYAVGMVGQYILLHNYLQAGNRPETVYLVYFPFSFQNDLDNNLTFHYFLKPFYYKENKKLLTSETTRQIHKIPVYWLCHFPPIQTTTWAPNFTPKATENVFISQISADYLNRMAELSKMYHFQLVLVPSFVMQSKRNEVNAINRKKLEKVPLLKMQLEKYLDNIIYLPDSCFLDKVHLRHPKCYVDIMYKELNQLLRLQK